MRKEIDKAVETFHRIALGTRKQGNKVVSEGKLASFVTILTELLLTRYKDIWYPLNPNRGSAYRCLRINNQCIDPTIVEGLKRAAIEMTSLGGTELTIWVDPGVVSVRIGEEGSIGSEVVDEEVFRLGNRSMPAGARQHRVSSSDEDEAYSSRSPSPAKTPERPMSISPPPNSASSAQLRPLPSSSAEFSPYSTSSPQVSYPRYQQQQQRRMSPPRMKGMQPSAHPSCRTSISSGYIPPQSSNARARALFISQDNNNGSFHETNYRDGVANANLIARQAVPMHVTGMLQGNYVDIPIPAMA